MSYFSLKRHVGRRITPVKSRLATCGYCRSTWVTWGINGYRTHHWSASKDQINFSMISGFEAATYSTEDRGHFGIHHPIYSAAEEQKPGWYGYNQCYIFISPTSLDLQDFHCCAIELVASMPESVLEHSIIKWCPIEFEIRFHKSLLRREYCYPKDLQDLAWCWLVAPIRAQKWDKPAHGMVSVRITPPARSGAYIDRPLCHLTFTIPWFGLVQVWFLCTVNNILAVTKRVPIFGAKHRNIKRTKRHDLLPPQL